MLWTPFAHRCLNSLSRNLQVACCSAPVGRHRTETDLDFPQITRFFSLGGSPDWSVHAFIPGVYRLAVRLHSAVSSPAVRPCLTSATINTHLHTPCTSLPAGGDKGMGAAFAAVLVNKFVGTRPPVSQWLHHVHLRDSSHANRDCLKLHDYVGIVEKCDAAIFPSDINAGTSS